MNKTLLILSAMTLATVSSTLPARAAQEPAAASLSVTATVNPAAPQAGDNTLALMVLDSGGKPATGLKLTTTVVMTSMDMGTTHPAFLETGGGHYTAKIAFSMNGPWRVVVRNGASKVAVLNFEAGAKTPWKSPLGVAAGLISAKTNTPAASAMPGMDMSTPAAKPAAALPATSAPSPEAAKPADSGGTSSMGSMDMKTATVPELKEKGTYTATGDENWEKQTGFGHNAGMVAMMNQMMVGGSGMEGMKMPAMTMKFDEQNYAKPEADDADTTMPGMDMSGKAAEKKSGPGSMAGMDMSAPTPPGTPLAAAPVKITVTTASAPKAGDNPLTISITDAQGKPVTGAAVTTSVAMTSMDMGTTHPAVTEKGSGQYAATVNFSMAGPWRITVKAAAPGRKPQTKAFDFSAK